MNEQQARILVVEDDPHLAAEIALRLQGLGYRVLGPVDTGAAAVAAAESAAPDLVLMDIVLPGGMDGIDAATRIARLAIPVIYLTAHADAALLERAKITEPLGYLLKPCSERELQAVVVTALYRSRTARKLAEYQALLEQARVTADAHQRRLSTLLGNLPGMAYRCPARVNAPMEFVSEGCLGLTGYTAEQLVSGTVEYHELIHPDDRARVWGTIEHTAMDRHFQLEYRMRHADGSYRWVWEQGCAILAADGRTVAYEGFITDTTEQHRMAEQLQRAHDDLERKVAERTGHLEELNRRLQHEVAEREHIESALRDSTERFRAMVEVSSDWLWEIDAEGHYSYVSPKIFDILGYTPGEILGKTPFDLMPPDEAARVRDIFESIAARQEPFQCLENINLHRDGHQVVLETSGVPVFGVAGDYRGYRGVDRDVSARRAVERALCESERHLRQIIDLVPLKIFAKDADGRFLLVNRVGAEICGLSVEEVVGRLHSELHPDPSQVRQMLADDRRVIESGQPLVIPEEEYTDAQGVCHILRTVKVPYTPLGDDRPAVLGVATDITEQKLFERELAASEQKFRAILENAVDAIFLCSLDGRIVDANRRAGELLGYTKAELLQMTADDMHPVEEHARLHDIFRKLANNGTTLVIHPVLRKGGEVIYCEVAARLIHFGDQRLAQGIFRDVTERERRSKECLAQEQQHRDTLVREVHHRIKNNLQGVVGLLREHASSHPELADALGAAIGQVQSISVVHGLQGQGEDLQIRLCDMVRAIARNTSTLTRVHVEPVVELAIQRPVMVDKDEAVPVALVINELILNAIKHGRERAGRRQVYVRLVHREQCAELRVANAGQLPAGFDYTSGQGMGTGLALVRSLLPHTGARLVFSQDAQQVEARLELWPPVVQA